MRNADGAERAEVQPPSGHDRVSAASIHEQNVSRDLVEQWRSQQTGRRPSSAPVRGTAPLKRGRWQRAALSCTAAMTAIGLGGFGFLAMPQDSPPAPAVAAWSAKLVEAETDKPVVAPVARSDAASVDSIERVAATFREIVVPIEMTQVVTARDRGVPLAIKPGQDQLASLDETILIEGLPASARVEPGERLDEHTWEIMAHQAATVRIMLPEAVTAFTYKAEIADRQRAARVVLTVNVSIVKPPLAPAADVISEPPKSSPKKPAHKPAEAANSVVPSSSQAPASKLKVTDEPQRIERRSTSPANASRSALGANAMKPTPETPPQQQWWQKPQPSWASEVKTDR